MRKRKEIREKADITNLLLRLETVILKVTFLKWPVTLCPLKAGPVYKGM